MEYKGVIEVSALLLGDKVPHLPKNSFQEKKEKKT
jgi:hypothetical protein